MTQLADEIKTACGVDVRKCFQCRKCSSGCPVAEYMDIPPARLIREILADGRDTALSAKTSWICASCYTCGARCPNEIDFARVADALRAIALKEGRPAAIEKVAVFHREFLATLKFYGRIHEVTLMSLFKPMSRDLTSDLELGMAMFLKGKLPILPHWVKDRKAVKAAFALEKKDSPAPAGLKPAPTKRRDGETGEGGK